MVLLIPPPRCHRHRYHSVLALNEPLRKAVSECAGLRVESEKAAVAEEETYSVDREEPVAASTYGHAAGQNLRNQPLALPKLRRRNEDYRFCDRNGTNPENIAAYRRAGSCAGDFSCSRPADILCGDRSNSVLG